MKSEIETLVGRFVGDLVKVISDSITGLTAEKPRRGRPPKAEGKRRGRPPKAKASEPKPGAKRRGRPPKARPVEERSPEQTEEG